MGGYLGYKLPGVNSPEGRMGGNAADTSSDVEEAEVGTVFVLFRGESQPSDMRDEMASMVEVLAPRFSEVSSVLGSATGTKEDVGEG